MKLYGYRRENGAVGIRNHLAVIPASVCALEVCKRISENVVGAVYLENQHGCCQIGPDSELTAKVLANLGKNPNVGAVLVVGLGCDGVSTSKLAADIATSGKPVKHLIIQENGGTMQTQAKGTAIAREMATKLSQAQRVEISPADIYLSIECGGSDTTSGLSANPAVGYASDKIVDVGGISMMSETTEFIGAEHLLAKRAVNEEVARQILKFVRDCEAKANTMGVDLRTGQPTPGNIQGGLSTIEEKSLGCIYKGGSRPIQGMLSYADIPDKKGFWLMDTPGQDVESITGMVAGGAQLVVFTTGRGSPTGSPLAPVIKVCGNSANFAKMPDNIDINAGTIIDGKKNIAQVGEEIYQEICEVVNGKYTKAESLGHREFGIYKLISTF